MLLYFFLFQCNLRLNILHHTCWIITYWKDIINITQHMIPILKSTRLPWWLYPHIIVRSRCFISYFVKSIGKKVYKLCSTTISSIECTHYNYYISWMRPKLGSIYSTNIIFALWYERIILQYNIQCNSNSVSWNHRLVSKFCSIKSLMTLFNHPGFSLEVSPHLHIKYHTEINILITLQDVLFYYTKLLKWYLDIFNLIEDCIRSKSVHICLINRISLFQIFSYLDTKPMGSSPILRLCILNNKIPLLNHMIDTPWKIWFSANLSHKSILNQMTWTSLLHVVQCFSLGATTISHHNNFLIFFGLFYYSNTGIKHNKSFIFFTSAPSVQLSKICLNKKLWFPLSSTRSKIFIAPLLECIEDLWTFWYYTSYIIVWKTWFLLAVIIDIPF